MKGIAAPAGTILRAPHCPVTTRSKLKSSELVWRRAKSSRAPAIRPPASRQTRAPLLTPPHQSSVQRPPFKILLRHIGAHVTANLTRTQRASCASELLSSGSFYERGRACIICSQDRCRAETRCEISVIKNENARGNGAGSPHVNRPRPLLPVNGTVIVGGKDPDFIGLFISLTRIRDGIRQHQCRCGCSSSGLSPFAEAFFKLKGSKVALSGFR